MPKVLIPNDVLQLVAAFKDPRIDGYEKEEIEKKLREAQANYMAVMDYIEHVLTWDKKEAGKGN